MNAEFRAELFVKHTFTGDPSRPLLFTDERALTRLAVLLAQRGLDAGPLVVFRYFSDGSSTMVVLDSVSEHLHRTHEYASTEVMAVPPDDRRATGWSFDLLLHSPGSALSGDDSDDDVMVNLYSFPRVEETAR